MAKTFGLGIDLGTTNSVASVYERGVARALPIDGGRNMLPSVVSVTPDKVLVGDQAKKRIMADPTNSVASVKRFMGDRAKEFVLNGSKYTPVDISAIILGKIKEEASRVLGTTVGDAVITVPAYFTEDQKLLTKEAGIKAGFNVLRVFPEPTAAALAYGLDQEKDQTILVYDLGGGTFDVSILKVQGNEFTVLAVGGDSLLGGDDFDWAIVRFIAQEFKKQTGIGLAVPGAGYVQSGSKELSRDALRAVQALKETAEEAKKELSSKGATEINIPDLMGKPFEMEITREQFDKLTEGLVATTVEKARDCLKSIGMDREDISRVLLVGGSTRMPRIKEAVSKELKPPYEAPQVDEMVAYGAAILADNLLYDRPDADRDGDRPVPIEVTDVQAHSLGVDVVDAETMALTFKPIIPRNSAYPCLSGFLGSTFQAWQRVVQMRVFRGEDNDPEKNTYLGELTMPITKPSDHKVPVAAVFELDDDGILHFTAYELPIHEEVIGLIERLGGDSIIREGEIRGTLPDFVRRGIAKSVQTTIKLDKGKR